MDPNFHGRKTNSVVFCWKISQNESVVLLITLHMINSHSLFKMLPKDKEMF